MIIFRIKGGGIRFLYVDVIPNCLMFFCRYVYVAAIILNYLLGFSLAQEGSMGERDKWELYIDIFECLNRSYSSDFILLLILFSLTVIFPTSCEEIDCPDRAAPLKV